jgi:hypothetical protein
MTVKNKKPNSPDIWNKKPEITEATVQVKAKVVEIKKLSNVYSADYKLIDDTIEEIKKTCRKVCTNDYATNNVYIILQLALKKVTIAEA